LFLLEPFAAQTDILQTECMSLSNVIPSLLDLKCHLDQFSTAKFTESMLQNARTRFSILLQSDHPDFNPLPAVNAACVLDPTCASFILGFDQTNLRHGAKAFIFSQVRSYSNHSIYLITDGLDF